MPKDKQTRKRWLTIRMNDEEYTQMEKHFKTTTSRELSDYVRRLVTNKPVNIKYRNVSLDEFQTDMNSLKRELNAIGSNFNQAVHKLHSLYHLQEIQPWILHNEKDKAKLFERIDLISARIEKIYQLCMQG